MATRKTKHISYKKETPSLTASSPEVAGSVNACQGTPRSPDGLVWSQRSQQIRVDGKVLSIAKSLSQEMLTSLVPSSAFACAGGSSSVTGEHLRTFKQCARLSTASKVGQNTINPQRLACIVRAFPLLPSLLETSWSMQSLSKMGDLEEHRVSIVTKRRPE